MKPAEVCLCNLCKLCNLDGTNCNFSRLLALHTLYTKECLVSFWFGQIAKVSHTLLWNVQCTAYVYAALHSSYKTMVK